MAEGVKISIVTISYNYGSHLEETIKSILGSGYDNLEYIVIDGGSTDGSVDIINKYEGKIDYSVSEPDKGISDALNKGIAKCTGDIIGLIHAGDALVEGALQKIAAEFEKSKFDFCFGDMAYIDDEGKVLYTVKSDPEYLDCIDYTLPAIQHPTVFVRSQVYEKYGAFSLDYKIAMDYDFFLRITKENCRGHYINHTLAHMHYGGLSTEQFYGGYKEVCAISIKYGYNPLLAYIRLYGKGFRGFIRICLEKMGLKGLIRIIKKVLWGVKYE